MAFKTKAGARQHCEMLIGPLRDGVRLRDAKLTSGVENMNDSFDFFAGVMNFSIHIFFISQEEKNTNALMLASRRLLMP